MTAEVAPTAVEDLVNGGAVLIDVREPSEWDAGHAPGALFIPMGQVEARLDEVPRDVTSVIICRSGGRSGTVTQYLNSHGINALNMAGGMSAWEKAGLPVVTDAGDLAGPSEALALCSRRGAARSAIGLPTPMRPSQDPHEGLQVIGG